ncbi:MAG: class I SAM-dependent methyltransferase [Desulforegulaceae bacterium]|nr:class I SAM-dependent methyltransferase [Desulforegulaceae bacterium]
MYNLEIISKTKGFMDEREGELLYKYASLASAELGLPGLEIGSYCGKSSLYLGAGCKKENNIMFSIDHHRGSEEQQKGEEYFDEELFDSSSQKIDTLPFFRKALNDADLENTVTAIVGNSHTIGRFWTTPLSFLFIDGGHSLETEFGDYLVWSPKIAWGGYLFVHDIFDSVYEGGQAPRFVFEKAISSGHFEFVERVKTLGILKRTKGLITEEIRNDYLKIVS